MAMKVNKHTSVSDDYQKCYPKENMHIQRIKLEESTYHETMRLRKKEGDAYLSPEAFSRPEYFIIRWGAVAHNDYHHLKAFINSNNPEFGSIYKRRNYRPHNQYQHQTMRNTNFANHIYEFGNSYVGIGFVDLFQVAWGQYQEENVEDKVLTFHGYDAIRVTTLRSKIINGIMKYYTEEEISTRSLLQIWFSSCWDSQTTKAFDLVLQDALSNPHKYQLDAEDEPILTKWQNETISKHTAHREFSKNLQNRNFDDVWRMKNEKDRVKFCRYLFTGAIFVEEKEVVCGNKTMFADVCGTMKAQEELFFKAIDLTAAEFEKDRHPLLFDTIVGVTMTTVRGFRSYVKMEKIVCHLHTKFVDPTDMELAATIKRLNPFSIDWSNVPDYFEKNSFIRFARACSVDNTMHTMHFINWPQFVFGAVHVDWADCQDRCQLLHRKYKADMAKKETLMQHLYQDEKSIMSFFETVPYMNTLNEISMFLAIHFRKRFEDFFLSDENGNVLTRFDTDLIDPIFYSFFDQSNTMIQSAFTFGENAEL